MKLRSANKYSVRLDNDFYILDTIACTNTKRAQGAFSYQAPRVWNELPYDLRSVSELSVFKKKLKTHLFGIAFLNDEMVSC